MTDTNKNPDLPDHQIRALVQLLGDENIRVGKTIRARILALGTLAVPYLHEVLDHRKAVLREKAAEMLSSIRRETFAQRFEAFSKGDTDLEEGAFLLAQVAYPDLNVQDYRHRLDLMSLELKKCLRTSDDDDETIRIFNHYLFVKLGFRGNTADYGNPENSYINRVLDRKLGIPISLSALYLFLSRRLDLPVMGVGMPGHFLLAYGIGSCTQYLDPFNAGQCLSRDACVRFITRTGQAWREDYLAITGDREILARMIRNLIASYTHLGENTYAERLSKCLKELVA
ncbi:MAG: SirB1 family protein [Nitrospiria bacterium]